MALRHWAPKHFVDFHWHDKHWALALSPTLESHWAQKHFVGQHWHDTHWVGTEPGLIDVGGGVGGGPRIFRRMSFSPRIFRRKNG